MSNTASSIEMQIDNFLEHFKRSASKAMDTDWISTESTSNYGHTTSTTATTAASFNHSSPLKTTRTRSSCFDISQLGSISGITYHTIQFTVFFCLFGFSLSDTFKVDKMVNEQTIPLSTPI